MATTPLTPGDTAGLLEGALASLRAEVAAVPAFLLNWHPAPGEWCIKEVIGHLIEAEQRGFSGRIRIILGAADPQLQTWDQNAVARERRDCARDVHDLLRTFSVVREEGVALARRLGPDQLVRGGHHPRSATCGWPIFCTSGCTTTATTSSRFSPTRRASCGRPWGTPRNFPFPERRDGERYE
jgi:hypothetical protein